MDMLRLHRHCEKTRGAGISQHLESTTHKNPNQIRVVFDSSSQYYGVSLNDVLLTEVLISSGLVCMACCSASLNHLHVHLGLKT